MAYPHARKLFSVRPGQTFHVEPERAPEYSAEFLEFWSLYPRRENKARAWAAWQQQRPNLDEVRAALAWQVNQPAWSRKDGRYIPTAANWITDRRWEDEPFCSARPPVSDRTARRLRAILHDE